MGIIRTSPYCCIGHSRDKGIVFWAYFQIFLHFFDFLFYVCYSYILAPPPKKAAPKSLEQPKTKLYTLNYLN